MKTVLKSAAIAACSIATIGSAQAAATLSSTNPTFSNPVGGSNVTIDNNGDRIRWGAPQTSNGRSGLEFTSAASQTANAGAQFALGTLTYSNNPITSGTQISSVALNTVSSFIYNGTTYSPTFNFSIGVEETPNVQPCPYPSTTPCSDRITISPFTSQSTILTNNNERITFFVDGFANTVSGTPQQFFYAQENTSTSAFLVGRYTVTAVPEPATWAMMLVGFSAIGAVARRRRSTTRFVTA